MSKVSIELDTETEELTVTVDGVALDNVTDISIYSNCAYCMEDDDEEVSISISQMEKPTTKDGLRKYTKLCASEGVLVKSNAGNGVGSVIRDMLKR